MANYESDQQERDVSGEFVATPADEKGPAGIPPLFSASTAKKPKSGEPALVKLEVSNPVTYLRIWWKKVIAGEGVDIRIHVHPLTAFGFVLAVALGSFGVGRLTISDKPPIIRYEPVPTPSPTPVPIVPAAYAGTLHFDATNQTYYLVTSTDLAVTLSVPPAVNLKTSVGKRILAVGQFNPVSGILVVTTTSDLEILPTRPLMVPTQATPEPSLIPQL